MKIRYLAAAACWMGLIWLVSSRPGSSDLIPLLPWNLDKAAHALEYAVLGFLAARGLGGRGPAPAVAAAAGALWGLLDEYHQSFVPGRDCSPWDAAADAAGALAGALYARARELRAAASLPGATVAQPDGGNHE